MQCEAQRKRGWLRTAYQILNKFDFLFFGLLLEFVDQMHLFNMFTDLSLSLSLIFSFSLSLFYWNGVLGNADC